MRSISKALGLVVTLLALPALAQTVDGGQGITGCSNDTDCGDICGWVCSFDVTPHTCVPAVTQAKADAGTSQGWCTSNAGCACAGQTCSGVYCTPVAFPGNGSTPLCICDSDCPAGQHCDSTLEMCEPTVTACNYDAECGCGCTCVNGTCGDCLGGVPGACAQNSDCGPACSGFSCSVDATGDGGTCVQNGSACLNPISTTSGGSSGGTSSAGSTGGGSSTSGGSSAGSTSSGGGSTGGASSGGSSGGACGAVGATCTGDTGCCSQYCKSGVCKCNDPNENYACVTAADCCSGTCTNSVCVSPSSSGGSGGSSTHSGTSTGSSSTGGAAGGSTGGSGSSTTTGSSGGCSTGGSGPGALALLALGLVALARRKRE